MHAVSILCEEGGRKLIMFIYLFIYLFIHSFIFSFLNLYTGNRQFKEYILDKNKLLNLTDLCDYRCEREPK